LVLEPGALRGGDLFVAGCLCLDENAGACLNGCSYRFVERVLVRDGSVERLLCGGYRVRVAARLCRC